MDNTPPAQQPRRAVCATCGTPFTTSNRGCYCAPACKMKAQRLLKRAEQPEATIKDLAKAGLHWSRRGKNDLASAFLERIVAYDDSSVTKTPV